MSESANRLAVGTSLLFMGFTLVAMAFGLPGRAEILGSPSVSVTSTSTTVTLTRAAQSLTLINDAASANEIYARVFWCGEATGAATTSSSIRLEPGESVSYTYRAGEGGNGAYCAFSHITAAGETATLRYQAK
jgi:hypothetical protein